MIRLIYGLRRREHVRAEDFVEHWIGYHAEAFGQPIRSIRRYVLYQRVPDLPTLESLGQLESYDGFASIWVDSIEKLRMLMDEAMPAASADEALFIDHARSAAHVVSDSVVIEPEHPAPIVLIRALVRRHDIDRSRFLARWEDMANSVKEGLQDGTLQGYIQSRVEEPEEATRNFDDLGRLDLQVDGFDSFYFQSVVIAQAFLEAHGEFFASQGEAFIDLGRTAPTVLRRHVLRSLVR
jgi:hypothetical protein